MNVLLLERVARLGGVGDEVVVRNGYARNFLIPSGKALRATKANREKVRRERDDLEEKAKQRLNGAQGIAQRIDGKTYALIRRAGDAGQTYGSVSAADVAAAVSEDGDHVARSMIELPAPIKSVGLFNVAVRLHPEISAEVIVNVSRTEEEAIRRAQGEDVDRLDDDDDETPAARRERRRREAAQAPDEDVTEDVTEDVQADSVDSAQADSADSVDSAAAENVDVVEENAAASAESAESSSEASDESAS